MEPADLLFADKRRINEYYKMIGSPSRRIKLAGSLKLSYNPSAEIKASEAKSEISIYDKIQRIEKFLDTDYKLRFNRPDSRYGDVDFVQEICRAVKIEVPARRGKEGNKKFTIWISAPDDPNGKSGVLVLVQDFNYPDQKATSFSNASTFSVLMALVHNTRRELDETVMGEKMPKLPREFPYVVFGPDHHPASLYEHQNVRPYIYDFAADGPSLLRSWNCNVLGERRIKVVYKVREWGHEAAHGWEKTTVFGYPIWIFAAP